MSDKVVNLFEKRRNKIGIVKKDQDAPPSFEDIIKKNAENKKRVEQERSRANKNVVRSHRLKR